ncbi:MAG: VOC family protein [Gemmobacter sp.]|nr:VOC family protein [Gemmobacter sp.]
MTQMIFVNLPVADLARSRAFYAALGFGFDERFCDDTAACIVIGHSIYFMVLTRDRFAGFAPRPVGNPAAECTVLVALSRESRLAVDEITDAAIAAGGRDNDKLQDYGFMYSRSFSDPDGNVIEVMWMDLEAAMRDQATQGA